MSVADAFVTINSDPKRTKVAKCLASQPFPHFEPAPDAPGFIVEIDKDGTRTVGRFINREFVKFTNKSRGEK